MKSKLAVLFLCILQCSLTFSQKMDSSSNSISHAKDTAVAHRNILMAKTDNKMFKIDKVHDTLRFTCWMGKKTSADIPDLVLKNGTQAKSDAGGIMWTFKNGPWTYIVEDDELTGDEDAGLFLMTYRSNVQAESERCTKTK